MRTLVFVLLCAISSLTGCIERGLLERPEERAQIKIICPTCPIEGLGYTPLTVTVFAEYPGEAQDYFWEVQMITGEIVQRLTGRVIVLTLTELGQYVILLRAVYPDGYVISGRAYLFVANPVPRPSNILLRVPDNNSGKVLIECEILTPKTVALLSEFYIRITCVNATSDMLDYIYISVVADMKVLELDTNYFSYDRPFFYIGPQMAVGLQPIYQALSTGISVITVQVGGAQKHMGGKAHIQLPIKIEEGED